MRDEAEVRADREEYRDLPEKGTHLVEASGTFLVFMVLGGTAAFFGSRRFSPELPAEQPVAFNHRVHVEDEELECTSCHEGAESAIRSGMPKDELCALCHSDAQGEGQAEAQLVALLNEGTPLEWQRLFRQPPHVFFSHRRHVTVAGLDCAQCHGDIGLSEVPPTQREPLAMDACIDCHDAEKVPTGCVTCHR